MEEAVGVLLALGCAFIAFRYFFSSSNGTTPSRRQVPQASIDHVSSIFPHIPLTSVHYELERTGNVAATVERCLRDGRLPDAPPGFFPDPPPVAAATARAGGVPITTKNSTIPPKSLIARLGLHHRLAEPRLAHPSPEVESKGKGKARVSAWEDNAGARETALIERKAKRVLEARRILLEREEKGKTVAAGTT